MPSAQTAERPWRENARPDNLSQTEISSGHAALRAELSALLTAARPRLLRLARLNGVSADLAEDTVQETLLEAWRGLGNLREPERFTSWLDGICRNICRRQERALAGEARVRSLGDDADDEAGAISPASLPDPLAFDPDEELERQDRRILLDRALGLLPAGTRALVELSYLAELPQREVAERLNMTLGALELKLYRARVRLRQALSGALREDAREFGLLTDQDDALGWREIRQWCYICGQRRLRGALEPRADGVCILRLRCPDCSARYGFDLSGSGDIIPFAGVRSLLPAVKRGTRAAVDFFSGAARDHVCPACGSRVSVRLVSEHLPIEGGALEHATLIPGRSCVVIECPRCGQSSGDVACALLPDPAARAFVLERPRVLFEPDTLGAYAGQDAIRTRMTDLASGARMTVVAHPRTLEIMATLFD
jgi:RNA polymerase sigma-70 factor (ECF subfamily)